MDYHPLAMITGASRGIGRATAIELARSGFNIIAVSRHMKTKSTKSGLDSLAPLIRTHGRHYFPYQVDIADLGQHVPFMETISRQFGCVDLLVNNAGVAPEKRTDILETTPNSFDRVLAINLRGSFFLTQGLARQMIQCTHSAKANSFKIIFITSISAVFSSISRPEYCISKAGLSMTVKLFADRLADAGIRVFEIRPGLVKTDMTAPVKTLYDRLICEGLVPIKRWAEPEDIARAVSALAGGSFEYSTGSVFDVSGGLHIQKL